MNICLVSRSSHERFGFRGLFRKMVICFTISMAARLGTQGHDDHLAMKKCTIEFNSRHE